MNGDSYPVVWLRWVRQQLMTAVAVELSAAAPERYFHLQGLPIVVNSSTEQAGGGVVALRALIWARAASCVGGDVQSRSERIADELLVAPGVTVQEPQLVTLLAWRLAQVQMRGLVSDTESDPGGGTDCGRCGSGEGCCDPEELARELVASGLIVPAWGRDPRWPVAARARDAGGRAVRWARRSATVHEGQMALPFH